MNSNDYEFNWYDWKEEQQKTSENGKQNPDIYRMNYKEFQCYIYNQLEEVKSYLQSILEVVNKGEK